MNNLLYIYLVDLQHHGLLVDLVMNEKAFEIYKQIIKEYNNSNFRKALYLFNELKTYNIDVDIKQQLSILELTIAEQLNNIKNN